MLGNVNFFGQIPGIPMQQSPYPPASARFAAGSLAPTAAVSCGTGGTTETEVLLRFIFTPFPSRIVLSPPAMFRMARVPQRVQ